MNRNALREVDQPEIDSGGVEGLAPEVLDTFKAQLDTVRGAARGEGGAGAAVGLHLELYLIIALGIVSEPTIWGVY